MEKRMIITIHDHKRLISLMKSTSLKAKMPELATRLYSELTKAEVVPQEHIPGNIVTMNSRLSLKETSSDREAELTITYPQDADNLKRKVSIFSPVGVALLGKRVGDIASWHTPKGNKWFEILKVTYQPEAVGDYSL